MYQHSTSSTKFSFSDPKDAITFLEKTKEKVKSNDESVILCKTSIGALKLEINDLPATKVTHCLGIQ